jgi:hypothetical protein
MAIVVGIDQLSTHMYASLGELVAGWRKNVFAAGRYAAPGGTVGRALYGPLLVAGPLVWLAPPVVFAVAATGLLPSAWLVWSALATGASLVFGMATYRAMREPAWYAFLYPLGLALMFYISAGAVARGRRVRWKDREYVAR